MKLTRPRYQTQSKPESPKIQSKPAVSPPNLRKIEK